MSAEIKLSPEERFVFGFDSIPGTNRVTEVSAIYNTHTGKLRILELVTWEDEVYGSEKL